ncbi:DNA (cytosine-5-)-methyltransferase [Rhodanobacter sp. AS-Z3]|uniref:DNA cytosine methyltransferase n=1 Tax=Rhodanobacter sp. AS-Z3 TaxID=3031330 RepID=UPI002478F2CA|nr:DNA (cytosine-5-)-methyltransferase [Rhodanobacter sp. AS-Z3]WEN15732.1 DNA (cytosine-5-)-methyltransferase [Rhodanobacter sp. AS-Z3]
MSAVDEDGAGQGPHPAGIEDPSQVDKCGKIKSFGILRLQKNFLSVVDLFAGCGGFGLGLEQAGFTPIYVNELNKDARGTYISNRMDRHEWFARDLNKETWLNPFSSSDARRIAKKDHVQKLEDRFKSEFGIHHGEIDLIVGGPPCQGFSGIGHRRSYAVDKKLLPSNHLYKDMARIIGQLRPRAFVFENVRGLLTGRWTEGGKSGEIWKAVKESFAGIGEYKLAAELVYAKNYGVAQNRPRIVLVGIRRDIAGSVTYKDEVETIDGTGISGGFLPRGQPDSAPSIIDLLGDLVDPLHQNGGVTLGYPSRAMCEVQRHFRTSADGTKVASKGDPITEHEYSKHRSDIIEKFRAMIHGDEVEATKKFAQRVLPREWGLSGPTITATSLPDDYVHFEQPRTLSVREWARLQGFPDWYQFKGKRTTGGVRRAGNPLEGLHFRELPKYTQIGNAVAVPMAKAIGEHLAGILRSGLLERN